MTEDFLFEIMKARNKWHNIFHVLKVKTMIYGIYNQQNYSLGVKKN